MRGEHLRHGRHGRCLEGSSPHARGTPVQSSVMPSWEGIIPACAGNTKRSPIVKSALRDHPRMRGEHIPATGSIEIVVGIIPACAGNTSHILAEQQTVVDHPRMRGEHETKIVHLLESEGSSPHARGTRQGRGGGGVRLGIIPACAGNTILKRLSWMMRRDHPRMRGEHSGIMVRRWHYTGSSPHARGTPSAQDYVNDYLGIIPACAGNTKSSRAHKWTQWDHPRMRGEHFYFIFLVWWWLGSSPHARGTPSDKGNSMSHTGIIPACAGNTYSYQRIAWTAGDHPRMRGEHPYRIIPIPQGMGSSPHARGTLWRNRRNLHHTGIIPACAGNTLRK